MKSLSSLPQLRVAMLLSTVITDNGLMQLTKCPSLRRINVSGTGITPEGIRKFKQAMPDCRVENFE